MATAECAPGVRAGLAAYPLDEKIIDDVCAGGCSTVEECMFRAVLALAGSKADSTALKEVASGLDTAFLLFSGYLVFMMQLGFAVLCAGSIRSKNCMNILLKNVLDACVGAMGFYLLGYGFAFGRRQGDDANGFIGDWNYALSYTTQTSFNGEEFGAMGWHSFLFQWSFCAAATTIVSGAVAERCAFGAYMLYSFFISSFVYPVIVHWVWDANGWLSAFNVSDDGYARILKTGAIDFAGSGVVHMTGGFAALMGAWIIGPRFGRFSTDGSVNEMKGHSATLVVMGTFLLWFGWYGFNPGSNLVISSSANAQIVSRVAVCTTLAGGAGGCGMLAYKYWRLKNWDVIAVCNGVLSGLVAVTAGCSVLEPWAAIGCGAIAALVFLFCDWLTLHKANIDDPVSAFALHGGAGVWGVLFVGIMAKHDYVVQVYGGYGLGADAKEGKRYGLFYGGHAQLLLCQFIEVLVIIGWVCFMAGAFFFATKKAGILRVTQEDEIAGLDVSKHGGSAYPTYNDLVPQGKDGEDGAVSLEMTVNNKPTAAPAPVKKEGGRKPAVDNSSMTRV